MNIKYSKVRRKQPPKKKKKPGTGWNKEVGKPDKASCDTYQRCEPALLSLL